MFSHEQNLLPFSTPQSYALLSAESKAADAANNKERLDVCHDMCGAVPFNQRLGREAAKRLRAKLALPTATIQPR